eukprot:4580584-Prymnesium_polylepis.1
MADGAKASTLVAPPRPAETSAALASARVISSPTVSTAVVREYTSPAPAPVVLMTRLFSVSPRLANGTESSPSLK